jgi:gamma-glutamylputrescine oxidase
MIDTSDLPSYWHATTGTEVIFASLNLPPKSEVVIIGGGLMGVATAYWLARLGIGVVLIEAKQLAGGASGRNAGLMLAGSRPLEDPQLVQRVINEEGIDAEYQHPGHLALASSPVIWEKICQEAQQRANTSVPVYALDRSDCEDLLKLRLKARYVGGRWLPSGGLIHPTRYVTGLAKAAIRHGAIFVTNAQVLSLQCVDEHDDFKIKTSKGSMYARQIIFACQAGISRLLPGFQSAITPIRGQVLATEPMHPLFKLGMAVDWGTLYWRQTTDGAIILGGLRSIDPQTETTDQPYINTHIQEALECCLSDVFEDFPPLQVTRRWAGIMDEPIDGQPIIGSIPHQANQWIIAGFGGHGLPMGLGAGRALAQMITSGTMPEILAPYDPGRFRLIN